MTWLWLLNFVVLQWFFVRLARVVNMDGWELGEDELGRGERTIGWSLMWGVWPLTGWWSRYRYVRGRKPMLWLRGKR